MNIHEKEITLAIDFPEINGSPMIFIEKIILDETKLKLLNSSTPRELYIFGALVKTGEVHADFGELKQLEFIVIEKNTQTNAITQHHLAQFNDSIFYKREHDQTSYEAVDMLKKKDILYLNRLPKWKASEASIPTYTDTLFHFCSQTYIPENKTTKQYLGWDETFYTFLHITEQDELLIQIYTQETSAQTAEDHYKLEEQMLAFDKNYKKIEVVESLIKKSDKFLHDYILNHKKTDKQILELLLKHGTSKAFKSEVSKKLK